MSAPTGHDSSRGVRSDSLRPLTIGSRQVWKGQAGKRRCSWLAMPDRTDTDALVVEEELETVASAKEPEPEAPLENKLGLPTRPKSLLVRDPRSPSAASTDGPEVRPLSMRY